MKKVIFFLLIFVFNSIYYCVADEIKWDFVGENIKSLSNKKTLKDLSKSDIIDDIEELSSRIYSKKDPFFVDELINNQISIIEDNNSSEKDKFLAVILLRAIKPDHVLPIINQAIAECDNFNSLVAFLRVYVLFQDKSISSWNNAYFKKNNLQNISFLLNQLYKTKDEKIRSEYISCIINSVNAIKSTDGNKTVNPQKIIDNINSIFEEENFNKVNMKHIRNAALYASSFLLTKWENGNKKERDYIEKSLNKFIKQNCDMSFRTKTPYFRPEWSINRLRFRLLEQYGDPNDLHLKYLQNGLSDPKNNENIISNIMKMLADIGHIQPKYSERIINMFSPYLLLNQDNVLYGSTIENLGRLGSSKASKILKEQFELNIQSREIILKSLIMLQDPENLIFFINIFENKKEYEALALQGLGNLNVKEAHKYLFDIAYSMSVHKIKAITLLSKEEAKELCSDYFLELSLNTKNEACLASINALIKMKDNRVLKVLINNLLKSKTEKESAQYLSLIKSLNCRRATETIIKLINNPEHHNLTMIVNVLNHINYLEFDYREKLYESDVDENFYFLDKETQKQVYEKKLGEIQEKAIKQINEWWQKNKNRKEYHLDLKEPKKSKEN